MDKYIGSIKRFINKNVNKQNTKEFMLVHKNTLVVMLAIVLLGGIITAASYAYYQTLANQSIVGGQVGSISNINMYVYVEDKNESTGVGLGTYSRSVYVPQYGFTYNSSLSYCKKGSTLTYNSTTHTFSISNNKDACYVYFDASVAANADIVLNIYALKNGEYKLVNEIPHGYELNTSLSTCTNSANLVLANDKLSVNTTSKTVCNAYFGTIPPDYSLNTITWEENINATSYNIYVDNNLITNQSTTSIPLYKFLRSGGNYSVRVAALNSSNIEIESNEYPSYVVNQVTPTTKLSIYDSGDNYPPEYSEYVLPDFDYINVLNFNAITTYYQTQAANECAEKCNNNQLCDCDDWTDWLFECNGCDESEGFYYTNINSNFCALNPGLCNTYTNITTIPFDISVFNYEYASHMGVGSNTYPVLNDTDTITILKGEHRLYYTSISNADDDFYIQFGKYGYVPSEWVRFSPNWVCVDENTNVYVYDERKRKFRKKKIKRIKYTDKLLVWDFDNGCFAIANPLWIKQKETTYQYNLLKFSDGSILKTINHHRIFNVEKGEFTYPMTKDTPIGTTTFNSKGEYVKLISAEVVHKKINYCNIITNYHMNLFTNDILTSCRLNNIYKIKDLKFIKDNRKLKTYNDFKGIDKKWFYGLRLNEYDGNINKSGSYRKDIKDYIERMEKLEKRR